MLWLQCMRLYSPLLEEKVLLVLFLPARSEMHMTQYIRVAASYRHVRRHTLRTQACKHIIIIATPSFHILTHACTIAAEICRLMKAAWPILDRWLVSARQENVVSLLKNMLEVSSIVQP